MLELFSHKAVNEHVDRTVKKNIDKETELGTEPVDGEEKMVDADNDRVPGRNRVYVTARTFCTKC